MQGSPLLAIALAAGPDGRLRLRVTGETGLGVPAPGVFSPLRILGEARFTFGVDHRLSVEVVDGHGATGLVRVRLDGRTVVDRNDIPVGYAYVDHLAKETDPPRERGSYLKFGVYAGRFTGNRPPQGMTLDVGFRDITTSPETPRGDER